jgi:hypothetical protein
LDDGQTASETQLGHAVAQPHSDALLHVYADLLDDLEGIRISTGNQVWALREAKGMADTPDEQRMLGLSEGLIRLERIVERELKRALRDHPLGSWIAGTIGIGEKQGARLLAAIGDPYWNYGADRPRRLYDLYAFTGFHVWDIDPETGEVLSGQERNGTQEVHAGDGGGTIPAVGVAPGRRKGQQSNWSSIARTRTHLVAVSCIKNRKSPYRAVYDAGREKYADAVHELPCPRCGPSGHPALPGSDLGDGHKHARAIRSVCKAILKDLWRESKAIHEAALEQEDDQ